MKAIIEMDRRNIIEVRGKDLTIDSNMLTGEIYVVDRADNRWVFCGHKSLINCVCIIDVMDDEIAGYLSTIRADGGDAE